MTIYLVTVDFHDKDSVAVKVEATDAVEAENTAFDAFMEDGVEQLTVFAQDETPADVWESAQTL